MIFIFGDFFLIDLWNMLFSMMIMRDIDKIIFFLFSFIVYFFLILPFLWRFFVSVTIKNCHLNNRRLFVFLSFLLATIKSEGRLRAAQFFSPALRRFFFPFFLRCRRLSLAFLTATRPRDSPADNLRYDTSVAPTRLAESAKRYSPVCSSPSLSSERESSL